MSRDLTLQSAAYYNIGTAQFRSGQSAKTIDEIQKHWEDALKSFQNAVTLDKDDADAKFNVEYTTQAIEYLKQLREVFRRAQEIAQRKDYHGALELLKKLMEELKSNPFGKPLEESVQKLQSIDAIANPNTNQP